MIVVELNAAVNAAGTVATFYLGTEFFVTSGTDRPPNVAFEPTLISQGDISTSVFSDGQTTGATVLNVGEIVINNVDGRYDSWLDYGFDGRDVFIRSGNPGDAYPGAFTLVFTGTVANVSADSSTFSVRLKDKQHLLESPALSATYGGTNVLPAGIDGTPDNIKGQFKPKVFGKVLNASPILVNTSKLIYQFHSEALASVQEVYDRGASLIFGTNRANNAAMQTTAPAAGEYDTCLSEGLIRLGSLPGGQITGDVTQGDSVADRTVAQILKALAVDAGISAGVVDSPAVIAMDALNSSVVGIYLDSPVSYLEAMDALAASIGAWYSFTLDGVFTMSVWSEPSGMSKASLTTDFIRPDYERRPARDTPVPVWAVAMGHTKNYTEQTSDLAGAVTADRRSIVSQSYRTSRAEDASIKNQYKLATFLEVQTLLTSEADALTEVSRLLNLHKVTRDSFDVTVPYSFLVDYGLFLGDVVTLVLPRFGLSGGKLMRIQGIDLALSNSSVRLTVWG